MNVENTRTELVWSTPYALDVIERAARLCYKSEGFKSVNNYSRDKFIKGIISNGHESVLEHAYASFHIVCDRGISHNIVRHRIANYSQESTRYCNYSKERFGGSITCIFPEGLTPSQMEQFSTAYEITEKLYMDLITKDGIKPEIARNVLPHGLKTELIMTCNFREWRHVLKQRYFNSRANPEVRRVFRGIYDWFNDNYPIIIEDLKTSSE